MQTLKHIVETRGNQILERWAKKSASARGLSRPELMNVMPLYLASLVMPDGPERTRRQLELVESHLASRIRHGFDLPALQEEFTLLGRCILQEWVALPPENRPDFESVDKLVEVVHASTVHLSDLFVRYLIDEAQSEKRFFRLIRQAFSEQPVHPRPALPTLSSRLNAALPVVMEALGAATVAFMFYDSENERLVMTASAGLADENLTNYTQSLATSSFGGLIASRNETTTVLDVETTALTVTDTLRHSGIRALLGVRVPLHHQLIGVLYIGIREVRKFSAWEKRRLEAIAEHLGILIENAQLNADLEKQIESLRAEQKVRAALVSVLAHDIRGPLSASRAATVVLARPTDEARKPHWIAIIIRNLDRATRMVNDLLDVERMHAGQRLTLLREPADISAIVRDVADELSVEHGNRFVVITPEKPVAGNWGGEELRRAIWNLATNALKYGSAKSPVGITVRDLSWGAEIEVHNEGVPIPPDEQTTLFEPFVQARRGRDAVGGWGLGLAVVRGVAEAHGGSIALDSNAERGTTFTMRIMRE